MLKTTIKRQSSRTQTPESVRFRQRRGAIIPLFAVLLPMLMVFSGFAINLAYMEMITTELKITTDAAAHSGGRAMSIHQTTDAAIAQAKLTIQANRVGGYVLSVDGDATQFVFGTSIRSDNGYGMYGFTEFAKAEVDSGAKRATSFGVIGNIQLPMVFNVMNLKSFHPFRRSIATQVDRDIALVLDRSGSMLYYRDDEGLDDRLNDLYNSYVTFEEDGYYKYHYWKWNNKKHFWKDKGYHKNIGNPTGWVILNNSDTIWQDGATYTARRISSGELNNATKFLYSRDYSNNVIYQLEDWSNPGHSLGNSFSAGENSQLTDEKAKYCYDWKYVNGAARYSQWWYLEQGVDAFLDVLELTDQEELVTLVTFNNGATLDIELQSTYDAIRTQVDIIVPYGGTAVGDGLTTGLPPIIESAAARPFAAKTIVVLTDGVSNTGQDPLDAVQAIIDQNLVTIHTVTFTKGADQESMAAVAEAGFGRHYHADEGDALIAIFEEIANNLPTILTE